jgi:hypothetical protein
MLTALLSSVMVVSKKLGTWEERIVVFLIDFNNFKLMHCICILS